MSPSLLYLLLPPGKALPDLGRISPFRAVVIIESRVGADWQWMVSQWLVRSGCVYMMAWGIDCSGWDDSVDIANLEGFDYGEIPEERFVFTTWHSDESLAETFDFCKRHALHPAVDAAGTVLLHIAEFGNESEMLQSYAEA